MNCTSPASDPIYATNYPPVLPDSTSVEKENKTTEQTLQKNQHST